MLHGIITTLITVLFSGSALAGTYLMQKFDIEYTDLPYFLFYGHIVRVILDVTTLLGYTLCKNRLMKPVTREYPMNDFISSLHDSERTIIGDNENNNESLVVNNGSYVIDYNDTIIPYDVHVYINDNIDLKNIVRTTDIYFISTREFFLYIVPFTLNIGGSICFYYALLKEVKSGTPSVALGFVSIYQLYPIIMEFMFVEETATLQRIAAVIMGIIGAIMLSLKSPEYITKMDKQDLVYLFGTISFWGFSTTISSMWNKTRNIPSRILADLTNSLLTLIVILFYIIKDLMNDSSGSHDSRRIELFFGQFTEMNIVLFFTHFFDAIGMTLFTFMLAMGNVSKTIPLTNFSLVFASIISLFMFHEPITLFKAFGIISLTTSFLLLFVCEDNDLLDHEPIIINNENVDRNSNINNINRLPLMINPVFGNSQISNDSNISIRRQVILPNSYEAPM
jgi:uncharacterized membrane protein